MKYMGSKSRIAKSIVPIIQKYIKENNCLTYIEPFVGGANVIDKIHCKNRIGCDLNLYLIELLKHVSAGGTLYEDVSKDFYDKARNFFNGKGDFYFEDWQLGNIGFLASYNGRWFDGGFARSGYEKTKNGLRYRNYYREAKDNLLKQSENLKDIVFKHCDYHLAVDDDIKNVVIYCDPPYANLKKYANGINFDYIEFWETVRKWSKDNIVLISEENAPDDFRCLWLQNVNRSINVVDKKISTEKLFILNN